MHLLLCKECSHIIRFFGNFIVRRYDRELYSKIFCRILLALHNLRKPLAGIIHNYRTDCNIRIIFVAAITGAVMPNTMLCTLIHLLIFFSCFFTSAFKRICSLFDDPIVKKPMKYKFNFFIGLVLFFTSVFFFQVMNFISYDFWSHFLLS